MTISDEGVSGTKKEKRYQLLKMIEDCKLGKINFIITKSISRFSRNTADCLEIVRTLLELNIPVYFEKEDLNTSAMESELILTLLSSLAESESFSTSENTRWGIQSRFKNGTYKITYPPYGYEWDGSTLIINEEQAKVVKKIFREVLNGAGAYSVATMLNDENIPTKKGGQWKANTINGMLKNEKYTGDVILQKTYTDDNFNRHLNRDTLDKYFIESHHEPIISHEIFDKVQIIIARNGVEKGNVAETGKYQKRYEFSGKIICGECGDRFKRRTNYSTYQTYIAWCCKTHIDNKNNCSMLFIRDEAIKVAFTTMMNKLIFASDIVLKPLAKGMKYYCEDTRLQLIQDLEQVLLQNKEKRDSMQRLFAEKIIDTVFYTRENNLLLTSFSNAKNEIRLLEQNLEGDNVKIKSINDLLKFTQRAGKLQEYNADIFTEFVENIIVYSRTEIGFVLKCGLTLRERI